MRKSCQKIINIVVVVVGDIVLFQKLLQFLLNNYGFICYDIMLINYSFNYPKQLQLSHCHWLWIILQHSREIGNANVQMNIKCVTTIPHPYFLNNVVTMKLLTASWVQPQLTANFNSSTKPKKPYIKHRYLFKILLFNVELILYLWWNIKNIKKRFYLNLYSIKSFFRQTI